MSEKRNPILKYKEDNNYTFFDISMQTGIRPQTLQYLSQKDMETVVRNTKLYNYMKLKDNIGLDLIEEYYKQEDN